MFEGPNSWDCLGVSDYRILSAFCQCWPSVYIGVLWMYEIMLTFHTVNFIYKTMHMWREKCLGRSEISYNDDSTSVTTHIHFPTDSAWPPCPIPRWPVLNKVCASVHPPGQLPGMIVTVDRYDMKRYSRLTCHWRIQASADQAAASPIIRVLL